MARQILEDGKTVDNRRVSTMSMASCHSRQDEAAIGRLIHLHHDEFLDLWNRMCGKRRLQDNVEQNRERAFSNR